MEEDSLKVNFLRTWKYIKRSKLSLVLYAASSIFEAVISAIIPLFLAKIIIYITNGNIDQLIRSSLIIFGIEVVLHLALFFKVISYQKIYQRTLIEIQKDLSREILNLEISEIDNNSSGLFIDRLNGDTQDIASLFMEYTYWISYVISNVGVLIMIFIVNRYMFIYAIITSLVIYFVNKKRLKKQYEVKKALKRLQENKTGLTSEVVRGIKDIKVLNAEDSILDQISDDIEQTTKEEVHMMGIRSLYNYFENNIRTIFDLGLILFGCLLYSNELLTIPEFVVVYTYERKIKNLLTGIVQISEYNRSFKVSSQRVFEVIDSDKFKKEKFGYKDIKNISGLVEFKNVEFSYDKVKILKGLSFKIEPNERVAFVGKSGDGKTTIFNLITKLYTTNKGKILIDDNNINDLSLSTIRDNITVITQDPYIFNLSIKDNLLIAKKNASMKEIRNVCKIACIDDYIMKLPHKYNTKVMENGVILSGGQKQRLAIARALLKGTKIVLFDEATSALDNETQSKIQKAINNLKEDHTIIIVAHRLSTVIDSDKIFVMCDGKIIDCGSHRELLNRCKYYKNLYEKDLNKI